MGRDYHNQDNGIAIPSNRKNPANNAIMLFFVAFWIIHSNEWILEE